MKKNVLNFNQWMLNEQSNQSDIISKLRNLDDYGWGSDGISIFKFIEIVNRDYDHVGSTIISKGTDMHLTDEMIKAVESYVETKDVAALKPVAEYISKDADMMSDSDPYREGETWLFSKLLVALYHGSVDGEDIIFSPTVDSFADSDNEWKEWEEFTDELVAAEEMGIIKHLLITTQSDMDAAFVIIDNTQR